MKEITSTKKHTGVQVLNCRVVRLRNDKMGIVMGDNILFKDSCIPLSEYSYDLCNVNDKKNDIICTYRIKKGASLNEMLSLKANGLELLWNRAVDWSNVVPGTIIIDSSDSNDIKELELIVFEKRTKTLIVYDSSKNIVYGYRSDFNNLTIKNKIEETFV